jgi:hypothetical protein
VETVAAVTLYWAEPKADVKAPPMKATSVAIDTMALTPPPLVPMFAPMEKFYHPVAKDDKLIRATLLHTVVIELY